MIHRKSHAKLDECEITCVLLMLVVKPTTHQATRRNAIVADDSVAHNLLVCDTLRRIAIQLSASPIHCDHNEHVESRRVAVAVNRLVCDTLRLIAIHNFFGTF